MAYQMNDFSYSEYKKFCEAEGIAPVAYAEYDTHYLWRFCKEHQIPNSVWDLNGLGWHETVPGYVHQAAPETDPALIHVHKLSRNILKAQK